MSKFMKAALASSVLLASVVGANAAEAATASADARANILKQVTVDSNDVDLNFGTIITGATASTVVVSTGGVSTCGTGLVCSGTTTAAGFTINGTSGETVDISVDPSVTLTGPSGTMTAALTSSDSTLVLDGTDSFAVGGTLSVAANQADGAYSGTFSVSVDYQ
ncbi:conserved exported hypothetical protein [Sphingorhabdus sp. 109]|jgi:hypothetical protein|nr:conserved exported hypothetical protein [Sphingorhabdus sp. 109]